MSRTFTYTSLGLVSSIVLLPYPYAVTVWGLTVIIMLVYLVGYIGDTQPPGAMTGVVNALLLTAAMACACGLVLFWLV